MTEPLILKDQHKTLTILSGPGLSIVLASLGTSTAAVTLPELSGNFQGQGYDVTLVVSVYILATTAFIVPVGRAGDLFGKRTVLTTSLCLYILGALLAFKAPSLVILIASRFVQGMGAAGMMTMPLSLVRDFVPSGQVGRWMGAMGTLSAIGTASGPAIGGVVVATFGWRAVYLLQIPLALIALALCLLYLRDLKRINGRRGIDLPGASALAVLLPALSFLVDARQKSLAVRTDLDRRIFQRYAPRVAAAFVSGLGDALPDPGRSIVDLGGVNGISRPAATLKQGLYKGLAEVGNDLAGEFVASAPRGPLISLRSRQVIGVLFTTNVTRP